MLELSLILAVLLIGILFLDYGIRKSKEKEELDKKNKKEKQGRSVLFKEGRVSSNQDREDDSFGTSLAVSAMTEDPMLGYAAGRNITGSLIGSSLTSSKEKDLEKNTTEEKDIEEPKRSSYSYSKKSVKDDSDEEPRRSYSSGSSYSSSSSWDSDSSSD
jgi:hypothetical protein